MNARNPLPLLAALLLSALVCAATRGQTAPTSETAPAAPASGPAQARSFLDEDSSAPGAASLDGVSSPSLGGVVARMAGGLVLVIALLVAGLWALRRYGGATFNPGKVKRPLRLLDKVSLGGRKQVCLVHACGHYLVLGVTDKEIGVLLEVSQPSEDGAETTAFAGLLDMAQRESERAAAREARNA